MLHCRVLKVYRRFRASYCLRHQGISETSVTFCDTSRRNVRCDGHLHTCRRENLNSHKVPEPPQSGEAGAYAPNHRKYTFVPGLRTSGTYGMLRLASVGTQIKSRTVILTDKSAGSCRLLGGTSSVQMLPDCAVHIGCFPLFTRCSSREKMTKDSYNRVTMDAAFSILKLDAQLITN
jgi:hypothetical protein